MEHTLRAMRITVAPMGVFMTASEANRQRVLTLLLAEREQMCTSVWAVTDGPVDGVSRVPIGWSPMLPQPFPNSDFGMENDRRQSHRNPQTAPSRAGNALWAVIES
jgi:hypothetical protein